MTHLYVYHDSFMCVPWLIYVCTMTHLYVYHDSFMCDTWYICIPLYMWYSIPLYMWYFLYIGGTSAGIPLYMWYIIPLYMWYFCRQTMPKWRKKVLFQHCPELRDEFICATIHMWRIHMWRIHMCHDSFCNTHEFICAAFICATIPSYMRCTQTIPKCMRHHLRTTPRSVTHS